MSRGGGGAGSPLKSGKFIRTLLAVISGGRGIAGGGATGGGGSLLPGDSETSKWKSSLLLSEGGSCCYYRSNGGLLLQEFEDLETTGFLEVHVLEDPSKEELGWQLEMLQPEFVYFRHRPMSGRKEELGEFVFKDGEALSAEIFSLSLHSKTPDLVYLDFSAGTLGEALHILGVEYVISWKSGPTSSLATHFRRAILSALRSSATGPWDAFQIANASFQIHCAQLNAAREKSHENLAHAEPILLGAPSSKTMDEQEVEHTETSVQVYDDMTDVRFLVCSEATYPNSSSFGAIVDGLSALMTIEVVKPNSISMCSAPPPPMAAAAFSRGIVTMRCDVCTASCARISLLVSGPAQTCFDNQQLGRSVKNSLLDMCQKLRFPTVENESQAVNEEKRRSVSVACGASVIEIQIRAPTWVGQVLRQLSADLSYGSLVSLGIAGVEGAPVAAFEKKDALHLTTLKRMQEEVSGPIRRPYDGFPTPLPIPSWLEPPPARRKGIGLLSSDGPNDSMSDEDHDRNFNRLPSSKTEEVMTTQTATEVAKLKPMRHTTRRKLMPFAGAIMAAAQAGWSMKLDRPTGGERNKGRQRLDAGRPRPNPRVPGPIMNDQAPAAAEHAPFPLPVTPLHIKPHGCSRPHIDVCSEVEFLKDVMHFLVSRGHGRLIPPTGSDNFPEVVLNGKRLDLFNLYREVVSRGGFHLGNGINWKGQVFPKMRNHTSVNKMTGVGNTLKKHYEVYLLEYELAHDDVDGECCILCHSGAEGDWVKCGICGEWAHFGCDTRGGLGTFKDYAKTDGLEYICPHCSAGCG
ncbi:unnamed protein product [Sphagnum compactum]